MIFIDEMKNLKIYKKPFFLPYLDHDKKHGSMIYLLSPNYISSSKLLKLPYIINRKYYESYYFEKNVLLYLGKNINIEESTRAIHNGLNYDSFNEYAIRYQYPDEKYESSKYYKSIKEALSDIKGINGIYSVYTHSIDNNIPIKIGEIEVQVEQYIDYTALYHWINYTEADILDDNDYLNEDINEELNAAKTELKGLKMHIKMHGKKGIYAMNKAINKNNENLHSIDKINVQVPIPNIPSNNNTQSTNTISGNNDSNNDYKNNIDEMVYNKELVLNSISSINDNYYILPNGNIILLNEINSAFNMPLKKILYNDRIKTRKEALRIYKHVKEDNPYIRYTYTDINMYHNRNIFYDLSYYNEIFFKNNNDQITRKYKIYMDFLERIFNQKIVPTSYTKKVVFIPVLDWDINQETRTWIFRDGINPISIIFQMMKTDINKLKSIFGNMDIIFIANNSYFKINFSKLDKDITPIRACTLMKNYIIKMKKGEVYSNEDIEDNNIESTKVIATNIMDKIENNKQINLSRQYTGISRNINANKIINNNNHNKISQTEKEINKINDKILADKIKSNDKIKKEVLDNTKGLPKDAKIEKIKDKQDIENKKNDLTKKIVDIASDSINTDDALDKMDGDYNIKKIIVDISLEEDPSIKINKARSARMMKLNNMVQDKKIYNTSIRDLLSDNFTKDKLPETTIKVDTPFKEQWEHLTYMNFDKTYDVNSDIVKMLNDLSTKQYPIAIRNIKVEDVSSPEDYIDKYHVEMEDYRGKRFTINMLIPKFKDNKYLILRGNKKIIQNQYFNMPILKTDQDVVQIISN